MADLQAGGHLVACTLLCTCLALGLIEEILELDLALLESGRVDVGQVIGNHIQVHLLGIHPRCRSV